MLSLLPRAIREGTTRFVWAEICRHTLVAINVGADGDAYARIARKTEPNVTVLSVRREGLDTLLPSIAEIGERHGYAGTVSVRVGEAADPVEVFTDAPQLLERAPAILTHIRDEAVGIQVRDLLRRGYVAYQIHERRGVYRTERPGEIGHLPEGRNCLFLNSTRIAPLAAVFAI